MATKCLIPSDVFALGSDLFEDVVLSGPDNPETDGNGGKSPTVMHRVAAQY